MFDYFENMCYFKYTIVKRSGGNMRRAKVRVTSIDVANFKNVKKGSIVFENARNMKKPSILGLYGQNGSGKTALVDAFTLLKYIVSDVPIPSEYANYINVDADHSMFKFGFHVEDNTSNTEFDVEYEFCVRKKEAELKEDNHEKHKFQVSVFNEVLKYSYIDDGKKKNMYTIIDTREGDLFVPEARCNTLIGTNRENKLSLAVDKRFVDLTSRSFVFSRELKKVILTNFNEKVKRNTTKKQVDYIKSDEKLSFIQMHLLLMDDLKAFADKSFFVKNTTVAGLISMQALPISFRLNDKDREAFGEVAIPLVEAKAQPKNIYEVAKIVIEDMNKVLPTIIPDLTISIEVLEMISFQNGTPGYVLELFSNKNGKKIPLRYESEGVKKIISVLQLLIVIYNDPSITVVIDELDSGIFEYLLGEILAILSSRGKGQLIFTCHNLRPLETMDSDYVMFTTTNPNNRYVKVENIKRNNNLRDMYYRNITLGTDEEELYSYTDSYEISRAFRKAGERFA